MDTIHAARDASAEALALVADRVRRTSTPLRRARQRWLERLAEVEPAVAVSVALGRPVGAAGTRVSVPVELAPDVADRMAEWSAGSPVLLLTQLATALGIVSACYGGRDDLLVATPAVGGAHSCRCGCRRSPVNTGVNCWPGCWMRSARRTRRRRGCPTPSPNS